MRPVPTWKSTAAAPTPTREGPYCCPSFWVTPSPFMPWHEAQDGLARLALQELEAAYENVSLDFIIKDLLQQGGAQAGSVCKGPDVPSYAVHRQPRLLGQVWRLAQACGADVYSSGDGKVQLEFPDGVRFVLNRQGAASQMWFAAVDRAWHYDWDPARETWVDDRDGHDLYANLAEVVGRKLGHATPKP